LAEALHVLHDSTLKSTPAGALISLDLWAGVCREPLAFTFLLSFRPLTLGTVPPSEQQPMFCSGL